MTKDELLERLENWYEFYGDTSPERREGREQYLAHNQIRSILNLHFSISDEERKEAREHCRANLEDMESFYSSHLPLERPTEDFRILKTILKVLGEKE